MVVLTGLQRDLAISARVCTVELFMHVIDICASSHLLSSVGACCSNRHVCGQPPSCFTCLEPVRVHEFISAPHICQSCTVF